VEVLSSLQVSISTKRAPDPRSNWQESGGSEDVGGIFRVSSKDAVEVQGMNYASL
jgi:hypothetical protein